MVKAGPLRKKLLLNFYFYFVPTAIKLGYEHGGEGSFPRKIMNKINYCHV